VGDPEGDALGLIVGRALGTEGDVLGIVDGLVLGEAEGLVDGLALGDTDGLSLGEPDGEILGLALGLTLGLTDGEDDGDALGLALGLADGCDGDLVGLDDGAAVGLWYSSRCTSLPGNAPSWTAPLPQQVACGMIVHRLRPPVPGSARRHATAAHAQPHDSTSCASHARLHSSSERLSERPRSWPV